MIGDVYTWPTDWRGLPIKRPYPWEWDVTVCIAAKCKDKDEHKLVLCTDQKISSALGSSDAMLKNRMLGHGWRALVAGSETGLLRLVQHYRNAMSATQAVTGGNVDALMRKPALDRKREHAEEYTRIN